jgi:DNA mismatch endonuclease (patch repair protein)
MRRTFPLDLNVWQAYGVDLGGAVDIMSPQERSSLMSRIKSADTRPELTIRRTLFRLGYRYRLHVRKLPGRPDIVFPGRNCVIFVHGCFWHRHCCGRAYKPQTRPQFWKAKFAANISRDRRSIAELNALGWKVFVVWECETDDLNTLRRLVRFLGPPRIKKIAPQEIRDPATRRRT